MGTPSRLERFLDEWLGRWPPRSELDVIEWPMREAPGWDGQRHAVIGVRDAAGHAVVSVAPSEAASLDVAKLAQGVFRWTDEPARFEPLGVWVPAHDPVLPDWLRPFGGEILVVTDDEGYLAGVGLKRHLDSGWEISVGTEPRGRGRGLARRLVATAARRVLDEGRVPIYLHDDDNDASARAADGAGFPDLGWRVLSTPEDD